MLRKLIINNSDDVNVLKENFCLLSAAHGTLESFPRYLFALFVRQRIFPGERDDSVKPNVT